MSPVPASEWDWQTSAWDGSAVIGALLMREGRPARFGEVLAHWRDDEAFRRQWSRWLAEIPLSSYCWELPPLTAARLAQPFECVFVDSPALAIPRADPQPFEAFFNAACPQQEAVGFANLGGDAWLVAPTPRAEGDVYAHLARFLRQAPATQVASIWQAVAAAAVRRLGDRPLWLSTAGLGVAWLHIRLDSTPKYYRYRPYTRQAA